MKPTRTQLTAIAQSMREELARSGGIGCAQRVVEPYVLALYDRNDSLRLIVGHTDRWPSLEETEPIARAFGVPEEDIEPSGVTHWLESRIGKRNRIKAMRYQWHEHLEAQTPIRPPGQLTLFGRPDEVRTDAYTAGL